MHSSKLAALAAAAAVAVGAAAIVPAANASSYTYSPPDTSHTYRITTQASLALDVAGGSHADNASVVQWPVNGGANQSWRFVDMGDGYDQIRNVNSGKCLTDGYPGSAGSPGTGITQWTCGTSANQEWWVTPDDVNTYSGDIIYSALENGTVDVPGGSIGWGTQLVSWPLWHGINQNFHLTVIG